LRELSDTHNHANLRLGETRAILTFDIW
jgi:hypothetical protein